MAHSNPSMLFPTHITGPLANPENLIMIGSFSYLLTKSDWFGDTVMVALESQMTSNGHQGLNSWDQNDSLLNLNDRASKRLFFNIGSKIPHKFANLVLICESQSNQRRPN
jgi:hypothetical protein